MHADLVKCAELCDNKIIPIGEKKTKIYFLNEAQTSVHIIKVDDCVIRDCSRTDYAIRREGTGDLLIELKGGDIEKACSQIESTIVRWKQNEYKEGRIAALVVSSRRPNIGTEVQTRSLRILRTHGVVTKFISSGKQVKLSDFLPEPIKKKVTKVKKTTKARKKTHHKGVSSS